MSVAIIGAGIAGLSAAYHIKNLDPAGNIAMQIFEARAEVGGRIQRVPEDEATFLAGIDVDMGALDKFYFNDRMDYMTLLNDDDKAIFSDTFSFASWPTQEPDCATYKSCGEKDFLSCELNAGQSCADICVDRGDIAAFKDASLATFVETFLHTPVQDYVNINTPVTGINYGGSGKIGVVTEDGEEFFDQVVMAVPISTLKAGNITFNPPIPEDDGIGKVLKDSGFRTGTRIWAEFEDDGLYDDLIGFVSNPAGSVPEFQFTAYPNENRYWNAVRDYQTEKTIITVQGNRNGDLQDVGLFPPLPNPENLAGLSDTELLDKLLCDLDAAYPGTDARSNLVDYYVRNYANEKHIGMTLPFRIGPSSVFEQALDGRIWFIGDYTSGESATLPAAPFTGKRVAQFVVDNFTAAPTKAPTKAPTGAPTKCRDQAGRRQKFKRAENKRGNKTCKKWAKKECGKSYKLDDFVGSTIADVCPKSCGVCV